MSKGPVETREAQEDRQEDDVIVLSGPDGDELAFQSLAVVEVRGKRYAVLAPADADLGEDSEEEIELFLFEYDVDEDGDEIFREIDDEATWNEVQAAAEAALLQGSSADA